MRRWNLVIEFGRNFCNLFTMRCKVLINSPLFNNVQYGLASSLVSSVQRANFGTTTFHKDWS